MNPFTGLSAFPITPADPSGRVDTEALGGLVNRLAEARVDSIGLLGSTGSYVYLTRGERRRAVEAAVAATAGRAPVLVGVGALRTDEAVALARDAEAAGADALLLAPVSYLPLLDEEVYQHVAAVAGASALPVCLYNNPGTTRFTFGPALLHRLAALDRVQAVKMPLPAAGTRVADELTRLPSTLAVGYSGDWGAAEALLDGAAAWYSVAGGLFPREALALARAAIARDAAEARRLDAHFAPLWALFKAHGSLRVVHTAIRRMGLCDAAPPRPVLPLAEALWPQVDEAVSRVAALGLSATRG